MLDEVIVQAAYVPFTVLAAVVDKNTAHGLVLGPNGCGKFT
jgi:hypothetical protein